MNAIKVYKHLAEGITILTHCIFLLLYLYIFFCSKTPVNLINGILCISNSMFCFLRLISNLNALLEVRYL